MVLPDSVRIETDFFRQNSFLDHLSQAVRVATLFAGFGVWCGLYEGAQSKLKSHRDMISR